MYLPKRWVKVSIMTHSLDSTSTANIEIPRLPAPKTHLNPPGPPGSSAVQVSENRPHTCKYSSQAGKAETSCPVPFPLQPTGCAKTDIRDIVRKTKRAIQSISEYHFDHQPETFTPKLAACSVTQNDLGTFKPPPASAGMTGTANYKPSS